MESEIVLLTCIQVWTGRLLGPPALCSESSRWPSDPLHYSPAVSHYFDRSLFLAMVGKTLYFGVVGDSSKTPTNQFELNGARLCGQDENPAEWMLEVTGAASGDGWPAVWNDSEEHKVIKAELARMMEELP